MPLLVVLTLIISLSSAYVQNDISKVWVSDQGNGTYKNPVLYADYSDLDVCRAGDDFYMTSSSFNCIPGLQILHSKDLVNWTIIGYAVPKLPPDSVFARPQHGNGIWAPSICYHGGEFYIYIRRSRLRYLHNQNQRPCWRMGAAGAGETRQGID
ncbi:MAG: family 43 glycosylhydrolase [Tannerella sp.]|jgi:beta-xylosidase|nr:family 43 glycosylhydrolase [Tannerella sp.]